MRRGARLICLLGLLPLLIGLALIGGVGPGDRDRLPTDQLPVGYESTRAVELAEQLPQSDTSTAVIVFTADDGQLSRGQLAAIDRFLAARTGAEPVLIPAEDGTAALGIVPVDAPSATAVTEEVAQLRADLGADMPQGITAQVTGPAGVEADLAAVFEGANVRLLAVTALVVAVLLIVTYRSPILWVIPLLVVGIADQTAAVLATRLLAALDMAWNESTVGILSVLVFGAGTNYALLLISRYRDELRRTDDRWTAMRARAAADSRAGAVQCRDRCRGAAHPAAVVGADDPRSGSGMRCGDRGRGNVRSRQPAGSPGAVPSGDLLARGAAGRATPPQPRPVPCGGGSATRSPAARSWWRRRLQAGSRSSHWAHLRSSLASTRPTSSCRSRRRSRLLSESPSPSQPGPPIPTTVTTRAEAAVVARAAGGVARVAAIRRAAEGTDVAQLQVSLDAVEGSPEAEQAIRPCATPSWGSTRRTSVARRHRRWTRPPPRRETGSSSSR